MTEPIRVLQVVTHMNRGGLETMIMNYYRHIDRSKIQFDFLTHRDEKKDYDDEIIRLGGKIYHVPPLNPFDRNGYIKELNKFFLTHKEYKIVHSHLDCMSTYPLKAAKRFGVPIRIAHSHNTNQEKNLKYFIKLYSKQMLYKYATDLFACGEDAGKWMFGNRKFVVLKNAIDAKQYLYSPERSREMKRKLHVENKFVLGHIGRFNQQKNHDFLVEVFYELHKKNDNSILLLVGRGELEEKIKIKVHKLGLDSDVIFLGVRNDIPDILQAIDVLAFPSIYEGLPVALVEAQASGLPCIVSDSITREIAITEGIKYLSLNEKKEKWAEIILSQNLKRKNEYELIKRADFDIEVNARWLEKYYTKRIEAV